MPSVILDGDFTVYYKAENNQKRIKWTGASTGRRTWNELYSALMSLFTNSNQSDDRVPIDYDTPEQYKLTNQWFIDDDTVEHLYGGSGYSDGWKDGTTCYIRLIGYSPSTEFDESDIGRTILGATTGDTGTILDFNTIRNLIWIRPTDPLAGGDEFDNGSENYSIGAAANGDVWAQGWQEDVTGGPSYVDVTSALNDATPNDCQPFPTGAGVNDAFYLGFGLQFSKIKINVGTAGAGTYTVTWEYWNGSAWTALSGVTDGTTGFKTSGTNDVTYTVPTDWAVVSVNGSPTMYYIRARRDAGTVTTDPLITQGWSSGVGAGAFASHTRHGSGSASGESAWVWATSIAPLQDNTHVYVVREDPDAAEGSFSEVKVIATKGTKDWWPDGHINICVKVKEFDSYFGQWPGSSPATCTATFLAHQYSKLYQHFLTSALPTAGGNVVIPLQTKDDLNNTTPYRSMVLSGSAGNWNVDDRISVYSAQDFDKVWQENNDGGPSYVDETADANSPATNDWNFFPAGAGNNDACYMGYDDLFSGVSIDVGTAGVGTYTVTWEYWNGSAWKSLSDVVDGTTAFKTGGINTVRFTVPIDWARTKVNTDTTALYYIRARRDSGTVTTDPLGDEGDIQAMGARGIILETSGANPTITLRYYLYGDLTDFIDTNTIYNLDDTGSGTVNGAPTNYGPALDSGITVTHGATTEDIGNGNGARPYSIRINPNSVAIQRSYERGKYLERRGNTTDDIDGQDGEQYVGNELQIEYSNQAGGNWTEGNKVYDQTTGAEGIIVADHDDGTSGDVILRTVRGTFETGTGQLGDAPTGPTVTADIDSIRTIVPVADSPLGTFAGGKFFGAPGVCMTIANLLAGDVQNYQFIDDDGDTQIPPNVQSIEITNLVAGDRVSAYKLDGSEIDKDQYSLAAGNDLGEFTVVVSGAITADTPSSGKVKIKTATGEEHRYRYTSFSGTTFTLDNTYDGYTADGSGCSATVLKDTGANFQTNGVEVGDWAYNITQSEYVQIVSVDSEDQITTTALSSGDWTSDDYDINSLVANYPAGLDTYCPYIERIADSDTESNSFTYLSPFTVRVDVRNAGVIRPFSQDQPVGATGASVRAVRNLDPVFS